MSKKAINKLEGGIYWLRQARDAFANHPDGKPVEDYQFSALAVAESLEALAKDLEHQLAEYKRDQPNTQQEG